MLEWKDKTSYSINDKERIPSVLELKLENLRIIVHRIIHLSGWYLSCYDLQIEDRCLDVEDLEQAKQRAIQVIIDRIEELERAKVVLKNYKNFSY